MTDYSDTNETSSSEHMERKKPLSFPLILGMALLTAIILYLIWPTKPDNTGIGIDTGDNSYNFAEASKTTQNDASSQEAVDKVLELGKLSEQGGLVALDVEVQNIKQQLKNSKKANDELAVKTENTLRQIENKFDAQFKKLTALLTDMSQGRVSDLHQSSRLGTDTQDKEDYPILLDADGKPLVAGSQPKDPAANFSYRTFRTSYGPNNDLLAEQAGIGGDPNLMNGLLPPDIDAANTNTNAAANKTESKKTQNKEPEENDIQEVTIPALAKVRVRNLHGINCPISGESSSNDGFGTVPVFIPIIGIFKGPNGETFDLGNAHLLGHCVGLEIGDEYRARINITEISYFGPDDKPQHDTTIRGYVMDLSDNVQDLRGYLKSTRGAKLAKASAAAAVSAISNITLQSAMTTTRSTSNDTVTQTLDGDQVGKAGLGAGFGAAADLIAQQWLQDANKAFDVVYVPSGVIFDFYSLLPINVNSDYLNKDSTHDQSDPLL